MQQKAASGYVLNVFLLDSQEFTLCVLNNNYYSMISLI